MLENIENLITLQNIRPERHIGSNIGSFINASQNRGGGRDTRPSKWHRVIHEYLIHKCPRLLVPLDHKTRIVMNFKQWFYRKLQF